MGFDENFLHWLEHVYESEKFNRPLQESSAITYKVGINWINKRQTFTTNDLFKLSSIELKGLKNKVFNLTSINKDRKSHYNALIKFKEYSEQNIIKGPNQPDLEKRLLVETNAINKTIDHFQNLGFNIISVEKDNVGWDLEARKVNELLLLEVKGLSGKNISVELTPNEYKNSVNQNYRICIVTNCLEIPILHIYKKEKQTNKWIDKYNRELQIEEIVAARFFTK